MSLEIVVDEVSVTEMMLTIEEEYNREKLQSFAEW